jgi:hypothetical protein
MPPGLSTLAGVLSSLLLLSVGGGTPSDWQAALGVRFHDRLFVPATPGAHDPGIISTGKIVQGEVRI